MRLITLPLRQVQTERSFYPSLLVGDRVPTARAPSCRVLWKWHTPPRLPSNSSVRYWISPEILGAHGFCFSIPFQKLRSDVCVIIPVQQFSEPLILHSIILDTIISLRFSKSDSDLWGPLLASCAKRFWKVHTIYGRFFQISAILYGASTVVCHVTASFSNETSVYTKLFIGRRAQICTACQLSKKIPHCLSRHSFVELVQSSWHLWFDHTI